MADFISSHQYVNIDGTDLSDHVTDASIEIPQDVKDYVTAIANSTIQPTKRRLVGVRDVKLAGSLMQDMAAGKTNDVLLGCLNRNDIVCIFQMVNTGDPAIPAATNAVFTFTGVMTSSYKLGGKVGDLAEVPFEFMISSGTLDIDTAP